MNSVPKLPIARQREEQERFRLAREQELKLLADSRAFADAEKVIDNTGFWLERWQGKPSVMRGRPKPQRQRGERINSAAPAVA